MYGILRHDKRATICSCLFSFIGRLPFSSLLSVYNDFLAVLFVDLHCLPIRCSPQVVLLSQVLDADVNTGYEYLVNTQLKKFNGVPVENLAQLAKVQHLLDKFLP